MESINTKTHDEKFLEHKEKIINEFSTLLESFKEFVKIKIEDSWETMENCIKKVEDEITRLKLNFENIYSDLDSMTFFKLSKEKA